MEEVKACYYQQEDLCSILRGFRVKDSIETLALIFAEANSGWAIPSEEDVDHKEKRTFKLPPMAMGLLVNDSDGNFVRTDLVGEYGEENSSGPKISAADGWEDDDW